VPAATISSGPAKRTGVAPLIGVLRDRARMAQGSTGPAAVYFGCRNESEFLHEAELTAWREAGVLSRLGVAFSRRDRRRAYVQDVIDSDAEAVWRLLAIPGARVMICGDARMADEVRERLIDVAQREGGMSAVAAAGMISAMRRDGRYVEDVWGVQLTNAAAVSEIARARYSQGALWLERMRRVVGVSSPARGNHMVR
jgi:cytochrome P450/NADPH-cytochrome P450 reductase